jgi:hypothetical protein
MIQATGQLKNLRAGSTVQVRTLAEIEATLDSRGLLEGLPFMPEMSVFCGQSIRIHKIASRVCVEGDRTRGVRNFILLENVRCDGRFHDNCDKGCFIFWHAAWLRGSGTEAERPVPVNPGRVALPVREPGTDRYICQSTQLLTASYQLGIPGNLHSHLLDLKYGNMGLYQLAKFLNLFVYYKFIRPSMEQVYHQADNSVTSTPSLSLNLQPGEQVKVKSAGGIKKTLDSGGKNQGLLFSTEMYDFCGKIFRVAGRVEKIILEDSARMVPLSNTVILENVYCRGKCKRGCPRGLYHFWREIWLEKI